MNRTTHARARSRRGTTIGLCSLIALFSASVGCGGTNEVAIVVVEPRVVGAGEMFLVRGSGFEWDYNAFTDTLVGTFAVELDDVSAEGVEWVDATQLEARVPDDMPSGVVDVTVSGPRGTATQENALTVRD